MPTSDKSVLDERRLRRLIEAGRGLVAELDPELVLDRLLETACEMTGARYAAIGVLDPKRQELERFITRGISAEQKRLIGSPPRGRGVLGLLIADPEPLRLADVGADPRSYGFPPGHPPMRTFLGVPILIRGEAWGNLYLTEKAEGEFDQHDEQVALVLAEWTAIAVDTAQSVALDQLRRSVEAAELERGRWARELHDEALQSMAGVRVLISAALKGGAKTDQLLPRAIEQIDSTIAEMRRLIADLRPPALDELGLEAALEGLIERLGSESRDVQLDVELESGRPHTRLSTSIEDTTYRLIQEALNNAGHHAGVKRARVGVREQAGSLRIEIADEGVGFDTTASPSGFGLRGMRERVELVGGTLELTSAPGSGTEIVAELPAEHRDPG